MTIHVARLEVSPEGDRPRYQPSSDGTSRIPTAVLDDPAVDAVRIDDDGRLLLPAAQLNRTAGANRGTDVVALPCTVSAIPAGSAPRGPEGRSDSEEDLGGRPRSSCAVRRHRRAGSEAAEDERTTVERVCFQLQVRPDRIDEYIVRHRAVRPAMLRAIAAAGRRNYSLFLRDDGLLIGYYETEDDAVSSAVLAADPVAAAWEAEAAGFFIDLQGARPDQGAPRLAEVFHLEDSIAALDGDDQTS